ncbi:hypothetical protein XELAEV_18012329mg [Xenopus laevis]|uniref:Uncharacterized protein n=1 Tax=Xenopus laevis TaxID=8355 RepID=A0A974DQ57_XENLA|nr:hypothetical protein XELAEV_18012329mg [Xenopus laevis]
MHCDCLSLLLPLTAPARKSPNHFSPVPYRSGPPLSSLLSFLSVTSSSVQSLLRPHCSRPSPSFFPLKSLPVSPFQSPLRPHCSGLFPSPSFFPLTPLPASPIPFFSLTSLRPHWLLSGSSAASLGPSFPSSPWQQRQDRCITMQRHFPAGLPPGQYFIGLAHKNDAL